jgi:hypothetical protein
MEDVQFILLCRSSREHFTFPNLKALMNYLQPDPRQPHPLDFYEDVQIFQVAKRLKAVPGAVARHPLVETWMLRERL